MSGTPETLAAVIAAMEDGKPGDLPLSPDLPMGAQGQLILAARACRRVRDAAADAIAAACEGRITEARELAGEAVRDLATMRQRLDTAAVRESQQ